jgi:hypothetical protein
MAPNSIQYIHEFPKKKVKADGEVATPRAQNADIKSPMNIRTYTFRITAFVCCATVLSPKKLGVEFWN